MYKYIFGLAAAVLLMSGSTLAEEVGRFQAVPLGDLLFVVDTQEGYLWTCEVVKEEEKSVSYITYQGRVRPDVQTEVTEADLEASKEETGRAVVKIMDEEGNVIRVIDQSSVQPSGWTTSTPQPAQGGEDQ